MPEVATKFVSVAVADVRLVTLPLVANRFVVVAFVVVVLAKTAFQRRASEPRDNVASRDGMRFVSTKPLTPRLVVVTLVAVTEVPVALVKETP